MKETKPSEREMECLKRMVEFTDGEEGACIRMKGLAEAEALTYSQVRRAVRALARKGYAEFHRGLMDDEGKVAGSGYAVTEKGFELVRKIEEEEDIKESQQTLI